MTKLNKPLSIGLFIIGITLVLQQFFNLPHFIYGFGYGIGLTFELIGLYATNRDISKLRKTKFDLLKKTSKK